MVSKNVVSSLTARLYSFTKAWKQYPSLLWSVLFNGPIFLNHLFVLRGMQWVHASFYTLDKNGTVKMYEYWSQNPWNLITSILLGQSIFYFSIFQWGAHRSDAEVFFKIFPFTSQAISNVAYLNYFLLKTPWWSWFKVSYKFSKKSVAENYVQQSKRVEDP